MADLNLSPLQLHWERLVTGHFAISVQTPIQLKSEKVVGVRIIQWVLTVEEERNLRASLAGIVAVPEGALLETVH